MKRFVTGQARGQATLFPERLDDFIAEDNPVRVVQVFVEELDLRDLGFSRVDPLDTGRPAYHPAVLLKLYIYGYLNRVQSSRRLERETQRNVEVMWLTERLTPDHKTIADFRKDNGKAIRKVCREFIVLCRRLELFSDAVVAIDGSKFKAVNNRDRNFTQAKLKRRLEQIDESIARYLSQLDSADREESAVGQAKRVRLEERIEKLKEEIKRLKNIERDLQQAPDQQISQTDPDARSMATKARAAMGEDKLTAVADRGYYKGEEILACEQAGVTTYLPKPQTSGNGAKGLFPRERFRYDPQANEYRCPAGERLIWRFRNVERGRTLDTYWSSACPGCVMHDQCTTGKYRRIRRWEHEAVLEAAQERLDRKPQAMRLRRQTVEHPFGAIKSWMGYTHFLTKTLPRVRTEMSLHVLAYNLKRAMNILGTGPLLDGMRA